QVPSDDRRARFVGLEAYAAAGGVIVHDLFDEDGGGYLGDAELLNGLAREKLQEASKPIAAEGWKWVVADPELDYAAISNLRRVYPQAAKLTREEKKRLRKLQARLEALIGAHGEDLEGALAAKAERLQAKIDKIGRYAYRPNDLATAGAVVALDY